MRKFLFIGCAAALAVNIGCSDPIPYKKPPKCSQEQARRMDAWLVECAKHRWLYGCRDDATDLFCGVGK